MHPDQVYADLNEPEETREPRVAVWRTGEAGRTIWWDDYVLHGIVNTPEIATRICEAMNEVDSLRAVAKAAGEYLEAFMWDEEEGDGPETVKAGHALAAAMNEWKAAKARSWPRQGKE